MSKKKLHTEDIANELEGAVAAFARTTPPTGASALSADAPHTHPPTSKRKKNLQPSKRASKNANLIANSDDLINQIRKAVKTVGKEVSFVRLTTEEKKQLTDIVYTYKRRGVKTSENEINRIAVNLLLEDYKTHGQASVLARVIAALLA